MTHSTNPLLLTSALTSALTSVLTLMLWSGDARAAVSADEARQLGTTLTAWGAIKAGNKEGTIPAYTGPVAVPAGYDPKKPGVRPDPFAAEKPLYSINAANAATYAAHLSAGQLEMLKKYATFRIDVYPTHRTVDYPKLVLDNTLKNATECKAVDAELRLQGCWGGLPFPIPTSGNQVMWNHLARVTPPAWGGKLSNWLIDASGTPILQARYISAFDSPYYDPKRSGSVPGTEAYFRYHGDADAPPRRAGEGLVAVDTIDVVATPRRVWQYLPGQRRVKLAPELKFDTPNPFTGGNGGMDEIQLFFGSQERYDFKLVGKRELIIPYNNFKAQDPKVCPASVRQKKNHQDPSCMRWELHRVWQVEATVKAGQRHAAPKRTFYFDEDSPGAGVADTYDASGRLVRFGIEFAIPMYETQAMSTDMDSIYDLLGGGYSELAETGESGGLYPIPMPSSRLFTPEALAAEGVR
jgi:hypothetical protein